MHISYTLIYRISFPRFAFLLQYIIIQLPRWDSLGKMCLSLHKTHSRWRCRGVLNIAIVEDLIQACKLASLTRHRYSVKGFFTIATFLNNGSPNWYVIEVKGPNSSSVGSSGWAWNWHCWEVLPPKSSESIARYDGTRISSFAKVKFLPANWRMSSKSESQGLYDTGLVRLANPSEW